LKAAIEKIDSKTLREKVYDQLRHRIIYGDLLPGHTVTLRNLSDQFGVSVIPIREALWQLETEGVIIIERNKYIRVNQLTPPEMNEVLAIRLHLESEVVERACEIRPDALIPRLKELLAAMEDSLPNPQDFLIKNSEFHFAIYNEADMPMRLQIIHQLWARVGPYLSIHAKDMGTGSYRMKFHHEMLSALEKKDGKALVYALQQDLKNAASYILPYLC